MKMLLMDDDPVRGTAFVNEVKAIYPSLEVCHATTYEKAKTEIYVGQGTTTRLHLIISALEHFSYRFAYF